MIIDKTRYVNGILLLYDHILWPGKNATTIMEHVDAFKEHSEFDVYPVNTRLGFPVALNSMQFSVIVLHWSLFGLHYLLNNKFLNYLGKSSAYKIAFFQDEFHYCQQRFKFLDQYHFNCVYTLVDAKGIPLTYKKHTKVEKVITTLTGYVSDRLIQKADQYSKPLEERAIDIGYRARELPFWMGKGAREKYDIAVGFKDRLGGSNLVTDIECLEHKRIYGDKWFKFLGNCKLSLGTMAGVSIFDIDGEIERQCVELQNREPGLTFEDVSRQLLARYENNIPNRVISPRIFEAAAFRVCQILFEDNYQGVLKPMVDYIPLKKDFSNFEEVMKLANDPSVRKTITDNCYNHLIKSSRYHYSSFISDFDSQLKWEGFKPGENQNAHQIITFNLSFLRVLSFFYSVGLAVYLKIVPHLPKKLKMLVKKIVEG